MELIIAIIALGVIVAVGYKVLNKENADGSHPLDASTKAPYKVEPPVPTTKVDGIGHETITVAPVLTEAVEVKPAKKKAPAKPKAEKTTEKKPIAKKEKK